MRLRGVFGNNAKLPRYRWLEGSVVSRARVKHTPLDLGCDRWQNLAMAQWSTQQRAEYLKQCWELKLGGHSGVDIAAQLGISHQSVSELLSEARQAIKVGAAASALEERREATERLDTLLKSVWTQAKEGDLKAVSTVLNIEERRAKLNGTDAPVKTATDLTSGGEPLQFTVTIPRVTRVDEGE